VALLPVSGIIFPICGLLITMEGFGQFGCCFWISDLGFVDLKFGICGFEDLGFEIGNLKFGI